MFKRPVRGMLQHQQGYEGEPQSKFPYIFPVKQTIVATWPYR
jgi:hypothetical protein